MDGYGKDTKGRRNSLLQCGLVSRFTGGSPSGKWTGLSDNWPAGECGARSGISMTRLAEDYKPESSSSSIALSQMPSPYITDHIYASCASPQMHPSNKHAADLSRLLDPLYCSTSTKTAYVSPQAYVDPYGDLHDPDYRDFPTSSSVSTKRHNSPRPHWELALDNDNALDDDSDEQDEEDSLFLSTSTAAHPQNNSRYSATRRSRRIPREASFSTYSSNYYSPSTTISTLPTSYESDKTVLSRCSDTDEKKTKKRRRLSKGDKEKEKEEVSWSGSVAAAATETYYRGSLDRSRDLPPTREEEPEDAQHSPILRFKETEYTPTCSQSLRRQWQAFALRFRFGVFRAQRKVMRRVQSLLWVTVWTGWLLPSSSSSLHRIQNLDPSPYLFPPLLSTIFISCTPLYHHRLTSSALTIIIGSTIIIYFLLLLLFSFSILISLVSGIPLFLSDQFFSPLFKPCFNACTFWTFRFSYM